NTTALYPLTRPVQVTIEDSLGNTVTPGATSAANLTVSITPGTGSHTLIHSFPTRRSSDLASFSTLSIDKAGTTYTLTASSGTLQTAISNQLTITASPATQLVFSMQPSNTTAGTSMSPAVQVSAEDTNGNVDLTYTASITVA